MDSSPHARLNRALNSLEGLSMGDAFGEQFFMSFEMVARLLSQPDKWPGPPYHFEDDFVLRELVLPRCLDYCDRKWTWMDDTALTLEIIAELREYGQIDPDSLAHRFARRYNFEPARGYGMAMYSLLPRLARESWQLAAQSLFDGQGSFGNGSAMRVAPLGAYFADDFDLLVEQARLSAIVTHAHEEAIAGAIATAVAAAICARIAEEREEPSVGEFLDEIIDWTPESEVKERLILCSGFPERYTGEEVASLVGSGEDIRCQDTVPFCCWCAAKQSSNFAEALWLTLEGLGDRDTTCAIVGGIVGARVGKDGIPPEWLARRETLGAF